MNKRLTREELSSIWKDGGAEKWAINVDKIKHLLQQRENKAWVDLKQRMLEKIISLLPTDRPVAVLEIGCGLGMDVVDLALRISEVNKCPGSRVVGLDFNTELITFAQQTKEKAEPGLPPPSHVSIEFVQDDATILSSQADNSFDLVRSDIALQHMDIVKTLGQIKRVLKSKGAYLYLEGAAGAGLCCPDEFVSKTYRDMLPSMFDGGPGVRAYFEAQKLSFTPLSFEYNGLAQTSADLKAADAGFLKTEAACKMAVHKGVMTQQDAEQYLTKYKALVEDNKLLMLNACAMVAVQKQ